ncbi:MAG: PucR family transcriptional regulator, partial [Thermomicrobiales bacterium]
DTAGMASRSGEITLRDLLAWEPQLKLLIPPASGPASEDPLASDVDWVVTARASAPRLPTLRGGELVLLPQRVVTEAGVPLAMLLHELAGRPVAGVLTDIRIDNHIDVPLPLLSVATITPELESELNRLLTSRREGLLRAGADLEHQISEMLAGGTRPAHLIDTLGRLLDLGITVSTERGTVIFSTVDYRDIQLPACIPQGMAGDVFAPGWLRYPLRGDRVLWVGPIPPSQGALARLIVRQLGDGVQKALVQDAATAPHGPARARVLNDILLQTGTDSHSIEAAALRAGLPLGALFRVVLHPPEMPEDIVYRRLAALGTVHDAGTIDGFTARIITSQITRNLAVPGAPSSPKSSGTGWIALSAPATSPRQLPEATRQARFIAALAGCNKLAGSELRFDDDAALGAYALLFDRWGSASLGRYVDQMIGNLLREDRRGLLRETLRVYLEHGGAQRTTSDCLAIHRNTLTYRLRQIREVLHLDPDDPNARLGLHLAVLAAELPPAPPMPHA